MSITEEVVEAPSLTRGVSRVLLVWDAPNLDMGLGSILGGRPTAAHRPRFDALGRWLLSRTAELSTAHARSEDGTAHTTSGTEAGVSLEPEATVFTNIAPGSADVVRPWVEALRNVGFAVFAKPKVDEDSDVDVDMLNHIALRRDEGLAGLLVASADGQAFRQPLEDIARAGTPVQVLGFREHASWALASDTLEFVDLEDIPGVFREPLPRIGLDSLPEQGAWLQPFRPLSSLLTSRV
ncbi:MAG: NYN domain-containing protein [Mycobacterium sp.]